MRQLSSGFPSLSRPVTACTITTPVRGFAPLVMKIFEPLMIQLSPSSSARVLEPPASEPASGSVRPKAASISPVQSFGSHSRFCCSVP